MHVLQEEVIIQIMKALLSGCCIKRACGVVDEINVHWSFGPTVDHPKIDQQSAPLWICLHFWENEMFLRECFQGRKLVEWREDEEHSEVSEQRQALESTQKKQSQTDHLVLWVQLDVFKLFFHKVLTTHAKSNQKAEP